MTQSVKKDDSTRHVSSKATQGILAAAAQYSLPIDEILTAINLESDLLKDVDGYIFNHQFCELWQEFVHYSGDPCIGLALVEFAQPSTFGVLGYAANSSLNIGEALTRMARYIKLLHGDAVVNFEVENQIARVTHTLADPLIPSPVAFNQWVIANIVLFIRRATRTNWVPLQVGFEHEQPEDISGYHSFFQAPITFEQSANELILDVGMLDLPCQNADSGLCAVLDHYAEDMLTKLPKSEGFLDNVRRLMSQELRGGDLSLTAIAKITGYAPRTLQRKLQQSGTSYYKLLDEMRRELSFYYLREEKIAVSEVAFLLGFSETSAFYRAFRRWTGVPPGEFRRRA